MRRRNLLFGLLAVATLRSARAEQSKKANRIAAALSAGPVTIISEAGGTPTENAFQALLKELRRLGYVEGDNLLIKRFSGEGRAAHFPDLAQDVVRRKPDVIISQGTFLALDFKAATTTIPIVGLFAYPVELGVVSSLARPGGNITGVAFNIGEEQWDKRVQLLRQVVPHLTKLAVLETREVRDGWESEMPEWRRAVNVGPPLNHPVNEAEYRRVFASVAQAGADGIIVTDEPENIDNRKLIVELAEKYRLPALYPFLFFVKLGGLMSYGVDEPELGRSAGVMVGQILNGAKPADIPIFQPTKFDLTINLKTAKALGLTVPLELLATADEVIE
jgi:putative tryptophan/tyrosine transport system substrate-binding protein